MELTEQQIKELEKTQYINIEDITEEKSGSLAEERRIVHWITTPSLDRVADKVMPQGVDTLRFEGTKTVFRNHNYDQVIGSNVKLKKTNDGIKATTYFSDKTQLAKDEYNLHYEGIINGWSIGFIPLKNKKTGFIEDGAVEWLGDTNIRIFHKTELLEYSSTGIPANADCLDIAKSIVKSFEYKNEINYMLDNLSMKKIIDAQTAEIAEIKKLIEESKKSDNTDIQKEIKELKSKIEIVGKTNVQLQSRVNKTQLEKMFVDVFNEILYGKIK